jgi:hypothetical protein
MSWCLIKQWNNFTFNICEVCCSCIHWLATG